MITQQFKDTVNRIVARTLVRFYEAEESGTTELDVTDEAEVLMAVGEFFVDVSDELNGYAEEDEDEDEDE